MTDTEHDFTFAIDGKSIPARKGDTILKAGLRAGVFIPHYCWHPGLTVAGNCRICLVHATKTMPPGKPVIACATQAVEGMEVESDGPRTKALREGVMEFLLVNHPLDCPVCDQAGECDLQQYSFDYGRATSRFHEPKTQRPRKDLGPLIRFVGNRCIVCTRCVRFCEEVAGTGELGVVGRGAMSWIDTFPGVQLDNPLSGCVADLCPVGALLDRDSMHTTRVWLLRGTESACGRCATGCNINVETWNDQVRRLTPRENQAVNRWWMCDEGRLSYKEAQAPTRVRRARVDGREATFLDALTRATDEVRKAQGGVVALTTGFATNEELFTLKALVGKGPIAVAYAPDGSTFKARDGFEISRDKNPNRKGVEAVLGATDGGEAAVIAALEAGKVGLAIVHDGVPGGAPWSPTLLAALKKAAALLVLAHDDVPGAPAATVLLPAMHWTEKEGTVVNGGGRVQRLRAAVPPTGDARVDLEVLQELARAAALQPRVLSAAGVFRKLAAAARHEFDGMDYNGLGELGVPLGQGRAARPASNGRPLPVIDARTGYEAGPVSRAPGRAGDEQVRVSVHRGSPLGYGTPRGDL
ncbi:MAG: (2Fe-2S)-binding protein [Planctomycetota bacterium]|nr:(2Fe-2S)-binding protein [Planctomycetota bacterium]